jgi:hypothetical protein
MNTGKNFAATVLTLLLLCAFSLAMADSPVDLNTPDRHSVEVKGKIKLFRVQVEGLNLGTGANKADGEVFVTLDSEPKMVYTLQLHSDSPKTNQIMADTLRDAYINDIPVTIYHQMSIKNKNNNLKILMVQMSRK